MSPGVLGWETRDRPGGDLRTPNLSRTPLASPQPPISLLLEAAQCEPLRLVGDGERKRLPPCSLRADIQASTARPQPAPILRHTPWGSSQTQLLILLFSKFFTPCPECSLLSMWPVKAYPVLQAPPPPGSLSRPSPHRPLQALGPGTSAWPLWGCFRGRQV